MTWLARHGPRVGCLVLLCGGALGAMLLVAAFELLAALARLLLHALGFAAALVGLLVLLVVLGARALVLRALRGQRGGPP